MMNARGIVISSVLLFVGLLGALLLLQWSAQEDRHAERLVLYCAAGIRAPVEDIIAEYEQYYKEQHGRPIRVEVEYAGSGTLLSRLMVEGRGDLYLAGDSAYIERAREAGLVEETLEIASMSPVIALAERHRGKDVTLRDLLEGDFRIAMGVPGAAAIGDATRAAFESLGVWTEFEQKVEVTKPTVNDLASDVKIGAVDAAVIWDVTARQFGLEYVEDPALSAESALVEIGVLSSTPNSAAALHFARFLSAPEKGQQHFRRHHFTVIPGDRWADTPEVNFFSGALNRRALAVIIEGFQKREGVRVNTVFQGCGALNAQMAAIRGQNPDLGFPDAYLACDVYYLSPVAGWFESKAAVSSTRIVIATRKDNPFDIQSLEDLARPGIRIVVGHPTHCTIGGLTERLFKAAGLYDAIMENVIEMQPSSGMMVPPVVSGAADASLAYYNDTLPEQDKLHTVEIEGEYARAVQPFGIASSSHHKHLMMRLYRYIGLHQETYEALGFGWVLGRSPDEFELVAPAGARPPSVYAGER